MSKDSVTRENNLNKFGRTRTKLNIFFLETLYKVHIHIRYAHDRVYARGGAYKRYSDSPVSGQLHKASAYAFLVSFFAFTVLQVAFPYFFTFKPREVEAGQSQVAWTSYNDFNNNNGATGTTTQSQATINGSGTPTDATAGTVQLASTINTGSGADGALTVNSGGTSTLAVTKTSVSTTSSAGQDILTVSATTGFAANDKVLVIQMTGTGIGNQEEKTVSAILASPARLQLSSNLQYTYTNDASSKPQVLKINQYTNVTVTNNTTWTVAAWDGTTGGVLPIKASGTVQIDAGSKIDLTGTGFGGGANTVDGTGPGKGTKGGFGNGSYYGGSGGGGGYGGNGGGGGAGGGAGGGSAGGGGSSYSSFLNLGSGGGGGGNGNGGDSIGGTGGTGGGAIKIEANAYTITGNIFSKGTNGTNGDGNNYGGSGGGGSGGSIYLLSNTAVISAGNVSAAGGSGGAQYVSGGGGGGGRIKVKAPSVTGTPLVTGGTGYSNGAAGVYPQSTPDYNTSGTVGGTTASNIGLRLDAGSGAKAKATTLTWTATTGASGQKVLFKVRSGDTQGELDSSACYGPSTSEANPCSDWTTAGKFFSQINGQSNSSTTILNTIPAKRYIEVLVRLESSGYDTPTLSDVTLTYDNVEAPVLANTSISTVSNGTISTGGTEGVWTKDTTVTVTTTGLTCTSCGTSNQRKIEVEVKPVAFGFDGTATNGFLVQGNYNDTTFASTATISGLTVGTSYHSRLRTIDAQGRVSGWTSYGIGSDTPTAAADFSVDQTPPTGTVSVNSGASYTSSNVVTLTLSASDTGGSGMGTTEGMRFSNNGTNWSNWETYATTKSNWDITNATYGGTTGDGSKTVYAQFKDNAGNLSGQISGSDSGLSALWRMDENPAIHSSTIVSATGSNNGTLNTSDGATNKATAGKIDGAITFDVINDYISTGLDIAPTAFSMESWVKPSNFSSPDNYRAFFNKRITVSEWGFGHNNSGNLRFQAWNSSNALTFDVTGTTPMSVGNWYHVAATFDGTELKLYINGNIVGSGTLTAGAIRNGADSIQMGTVNLSANRYFGGQMDEAAIYTRAISSAEIATRLVFISDTISLDMAPPAAFELSSPADNTWQVSATPTLSWAASSDGNGLSKYQLYIDGNLDTDNISNAATSQAVTNALSAGSHTWYIKAVDNAGNITQSTSTWNVGYDNTVPSAVTGLSATEDNSTTITVTWNAYSDSGSPITNYQLQRVLKSDYDQFSLTPTGAWGGAASLAQITCGNTTSMAETTSSVTGTGCVKDSGEFVAESTAYYYRIAAKDTANASYGAWSAAIDQGMTADVIDPSSPSNVQVSACDGTNNCSAVTGITHKGYELKLTWSASSDAGTGVARYKIWRTTVASSTDQNDYTVAGALEVTGPVTTQWFDNDANNAATTLFYDNDDTDTATIIVPSGVKTQASSNLADYQTYYYRMTAVDGASNESDFIPTLINNYGSGRTDDISAPTISQITGVTANSITELQIDWPNWQDKSSRDVAVNGSGVNQYNVERSYNGTSGWLEVGTVTGTPPTNQFIDNVYDSYDIWGATTTIPSGITAGSPASGGTLTVADASTLANSGRIQVENEYIDYSSKTGNTLNSITRGTIGSTAADHTGGTTVYKVDRFKGLQSYYYRIKARDVAGKWAGYTSNTANSTTTTPDATAPSAPTLVNATATKGNNATDANVGHRVTFTWTGSQDNGTVQGYKIYRSTNGSLTTNQWLALTPIKVITSADSGFTNLPLADDTGNQRTWIDSGLTDATTYYYRISAYDNASPTSLSSSLSASSTPSTKAFDTTPDDTAPDTPDQVKIQAIWGANSGDIRVVVTWQKVATPTRNGSNDFKEYRVYKSTDNITFSQLLVNGSNPLYNSNKSTAIENNYYVDSDVQSDGTQYYYRVTAVDDAGTEYKYANPPFDNTDVINAVNNESSVSATVELNPSQVIPQVNTLSNSKKASLSDVGVSSATVTWETNQATESVVAYRKAGTSDSFITTGTEGMGTAHSVTLRALEAGASYEYRVSGKNAIGNDKKVGYGQDDDGIGDSSTGNDDVPVLTTSPFNISNYSVSTTTTTATVIWTTNIDSDSNVEYKKEARIGEAAEDSQTAGDPKLATSHEVVIKALRPDTNYTYKIRSVTNDKFISETQFLTFKTKPYDASQFVISPNASSIAEQNITATSAKIVWNTLVATTTWVDYGTSSGNYNQSAGDNKYNTVHVVELLNLTPGTTYYYKVRGTDTNDIEYTSQEYSFTAVLLPQIINSKTSDLTSYTITINWETNVSATSFVAYGKDTTYGSGVGETEPSKAHSTKLENLEDNTTYHYQITVKDQFSNEAKSADLTFTTPIDNAGPEVKEVKIDILPMGTDDETASAIISWVTSKPATTQIDYDEGVIGGKYSKHSVEDKNLNGAHTVIIKELNPSTTYHFRIVSKDKRGNTGNSQDYNFVTPTKEKSILQLIIRSLEETFSWVSQMPRFFKGLGQRITGR